MGQQGQVGFCCWGAGGIRTGAVSVVCDWADPCSWAMGWTAVSDENLCSRTFRILASMACAHV